jgi:hypothetical protein
MLPDQHFYNTGIFTYIWLLRNDKPANHKGRVMLIDARQQFEKEPKSFGNKRHRITDAHRAWIKERYNKGWAKGYADEQVKIFPREDFAYHKVSVVFWQTDEHDQPAIADYFDAKEHESHLISSNIVSEPEVSKLVVFEGKRIRKVLHEGAWWFVVEDVVLALIESRDPKQYIQRMKQRDPELDKVAKYAENHITFRPHFYFGDANHEIDFVFYLNGLPIVALELKHEANQNVHDAVSQYTRRDQTLKIFQYPFLYLAADTSDAMAATDPRKEENFRWHNMGLTNTPTNAGEYPVEFLYREVLSQDQLLEALSFFLVRVPERAAEDDKQARPASTIFPRYHQSRLVRRVAEDITAHFATVSDVGKKYLADHSAGSGKTLSICWLADRLHSLFKPCTNEKLVDITFILTDRKSLDTNIREDIDKFAHLKDVVGIAKKSEDLLRFLKERKSIIVTT